METAVGAFGDILGMGSHPSNVSILMRPQISINNLQTECRGFTKRNGAPPIFATEDCRERLGETK